MGGVQVKDNTSEETFQPFAHALVGVGHNRNRIRTTCTNGNCPPGLVINRTLSDTGIAGGFGGGVDIKLTDKFSSRLVVDYNPIYSNTRLDNNVRFSFGIVFK